MKKTLLTLGAVVAMTLGFASCGDEDCDCYAVIDGEKTELTVNDSFPTVTEVDDCDDVKESDLPSQWSNLSEVFGTTVEIQCSKH